MNKYIVHYQIGSTYGKTYVEAHSKFQAGDIARIQIQSIRRSKASFTVILVLEEGEPMPYKDLAEKYLVKKA
jgi:hypothetical protein